jgi:hypothetical protein
MRALSFRPFYPSDSRRVSLWYLSAGLRYTAEYPLEIGGDIPGARHGPRAGDGAAAKHAPRILPTCVAGIQFAHSSPPMKGWDSLWRAADGRHQRLLADRRGGSMTSCRTAGIMARAERFVHAVPLCREAAPAIIHTWHPGRAARRRRGEAAREE